MEPYRCGCYRFVVIQIVGNGLLWDRDDSDFRPGWTMACARDEVKMLVKTAES